MANRISIKWAIAFVQLLSQLVNCDFTQCGTVDVARPLIFGGNQTLRGEWPFIAALFHIDNYRFFCGGTVITNRHVLTGKLSLCCSKIRIYFCGQ